jgi:hypothetical protein
VLFWALLLASGCCPAVGGQLSPEAAIRHAVLGAADDDLESVEQVSPDAESARRTYEFLHSALGLPQGTYVADEGIERLSGARFRVLVTLDDSPDAELFAEVRRNSTGGWAVVRMWKDEEPRCAEARTCGCLVVGMSASYT